ncbi:MAG: hypothetical protein M9950_06990 [Thermomicrobiales bacterium]|nr:hypothetical protein [Thermomicrobiales bacterium]
MVVINSSDGAFITAAPKRRVVDEIEIVLSQPEAEDFRIERAMPIPVNRMAVLRLPDIVGD